MYPEAKITLVNERYNNKKLLTVKPVYMNVQQWYTFSEKGHGKKKDCY